MCSRVLGTLLVAVAACGGSPGPRSSQRAADSSDAVVFGTEAWRMPGSVDFIDVREGDLVAASQDGAVVRFLRDGSRTVIAEGVVDQAHDIALLDRDSMVFAGPTPTIVDLATGTVRPFNGGEATRLAIAGKRAVIGGKDTPLAVTELGSQRSRILLAHSVHYDEPSIVGPWAIAGRSQKSVGIWDLATGKRHRVFALGNTSVFALSPDRQWIVAGTFADKPNWAVDVYRVDDGRSMATIGFACNPGAVAISADSKLLAIACDEELRIVKLPSGERVASIPGTGAYVRTVAWSPSGDVVALGGNDNVLHAWRAPTWEPLGRVEGSRGVVRELAVAGRYLVTHSWGDSSAWLWVTDLVKPVIELGGKHREVMAVATDGDHTLVAVTRTGEKKRGASIERWRGAARITSQELPDGKFGMAHLIREIGPISDGGVWFSSGGRVTTLDRELKITWTSPAPSDDDALDGNAAATSDGRVVILRAHGEITVIDAAERRVLIRTPHVTCFASPPEIAPDGKRAAVIEPSGISILDTTTGKVSGSLGFVTPTGAERALTWRSNDEVVGLAGGRVVAWKIGTPTAVTGRAPNAVSIAVATDHVYLGRTDGTVVRRSYDALFTGGTIPAALATPCKPEEGGGLLGSLGMSGDTPPRGRLDDNESHDEPDPDPEGLPDNLFDDDED